MSGPIFLMSLSAVGSFLPVLTWAALTQWGAWPNSMAFFFTAVAVVIVGCALGLVAEEQSTRAIVVLVGATIIGCICWTPPLFVGILWRQMISALQGVNGRALTLICLGTWLLTFLARWGMREAITTAEGWAVCGMLLAVIATYYRVCLICDDQSPIGEDEVKVNLIAIAMVGIPAAIAIAATHGTAWPLMAAAIATFALGWFQWAKYTHQQQTKPDPDEAERVAAMARANAALSSEAFEPAAWNRPDRKHTGRPSPFGAKLNNACLAISDFFSGLIGYK
jgi:hypothetical protein